MTSSTYEFHEVLFPSFEFDNNLVSFNILINRMVVKSTKTHGSGMTPASKISQNFSTCG